MPKPSAAVEWIGGLTSMPAFVTGAGEPYRPELLLWLDADGLVLGTEVDQPGTLLARAGQSLRQAMERPMVGEPRAPTRVRVASGELADVLRAAHPAIEIVCAPTPELAEVMDSMRARLADRGEDSPDSYLGLAPEETPELMAAVFRAAAALYRAEPWEVLPEDSQVVVTSAALGLDAAIVSVIGHLDEVLGWVLFSSRDAFEAFVGAADALERGERPTMPPHFALNYEFGADLSPALRKEVARHGWEVAGPEAYPWMFAVEDELLGRPPSASELWRTEALCLALTAFVQGGGTGLGTLKVPTHKGEVELTLSAEPPLDDGAADEALGALLDRFELSPEGRGLEEAGFSQMVLDLANDHLGETIATLKPEGLRRVLFEIFPRKISIRADEAGHVIAELRALYAFLKRETGLPQADACLAVLGGDAEQRLQAALSDPGNFGLAKSLFMGAQEAGFDLSSQAGIDAWMRKTGGKVPDSVRLPGDHGRAVPRAGKADKAAKKPKRKAARKARRKNR